MPYFTNRKHAYRILRRFQNGKVRLASTYGAEFVVQESVLLENGYYVVKNKPACFDPDEQIRRLAQRAKP